MNVDGSSLLRLTNNNSTDDSPVWLAPGTQTVFRSDRDGNSEIYRMSSDGSSQTNLIQNGDNDAAPSWEL